MVVETERFNKEKVLLDTMEAEPRPFSLKEIANYIKISLDKFVEEHESELVREVRRDDYEDVPELPIYEHFYFDELVPKVRKMMVNSGYNGEQIESMIIHYDEFFYRSILPSVCRNNRSYTKHDESIASQNPP